MTATCAVAMDDVMELLDSAITNAAALVEPEYREDQDCDAINNIALGVAAVFDSLYMGLGSETKRLFVSNLVVYAAKDDPDLNTLSILAGAFEYDLENLGADDVEVILFLESFIFLRLLFYGERQFERSLAEMDLPDLDAED